MGSKIAPGLKKTPQDQASPPPVPTTGTSKEAEPKASEKQLMSEIVQTSEAIDREHLDKVEAEIADAKRVNGEIKLPPDVADSGVKSPEQDAEEVVKSGPTVSIPLTEDEYKGGQKQKAGGKVTLNGVVYGVNSLIALVAWAGRMIRLAHSHAKKVIFKNAN